MQDVGIGIYAFLLAEGDLFKKKSFNLVVFMALFDCFLVLLLREAATLWEYITQMKMIANS